MGSLEATIQATFETAGVPVFFGICKEKVKPVQYIVWILALVTPELHGDDRPLERGYYIQANIWSSIEYFDLAVSVKAVMEAAGFLVRDERDGIYDSGTGYYNRIQRYFYLEEE
jgi:hypothetical protein